MPHILVKLYQLTIHRIFSLLTKHSTNSIKANCTYNQLPDLLTLQVRWIFDYTHEDYLITIMFAA